MQTVVFTRMALKKAIQAGVAKIVIGNPRMAGQILRVLRFKPSFMAMSTIIPPVLFPPLAPLFLFVAVSVLALGAILYLAFLEGYEVVVEKRANEESPSIIIRKRQVLTVQPQTESQAEPKSDAIPASEPTS